MYTFGRGEEQLSDVVHNPFDQDPASNQGMYARGKVKPAKSCNPKPSSPQALKPQPYTRPIWKLPWSGIWKRSPVASGLLDQPLAPSSICDKAVIAIEHKGSPDLHQALVLNPLTPALPPTKVVTASTLQEKMQPVLTSGPALSTKLLGTSRLHRDTPTQGHTFKTGIGKCFSKFQRDRGS